LIHLICLDDSKLLTTTWLHVERDTQSISAKASNSYTIVKLYGLLKKKNVNKSL